MLATQFVSGLKLVVSEQIITGSTASFVVSEYPALISPVSDRKSGGGYHHFDPDSEQDRVEIETQAARTFTAWINNYRSVAQRNGLDLTQMEEFVIILRGEPGMEEARYV